MQDLHVIRGDAKSVGSYLRPGGLVALAVGRGASHNLDLARAEHPRRRGLPASTLDAYVAEHPRGSVAADLRVGGEPETELDGITRLAALLLLGAQPLVVRQLQDPIQRRLEVERVVLDAGGGVGGVVEPAAENS